MDSLSGWLLSQASPAAISLCEAGEIARDEFTAHVAALVDDLEERDATGATITAGCVLPGFRRYPQPETSRYYILFHRMLATSSGAAIRETYLKKINQMPSPPRDFGGCGPWSLVMDVEYTRNLFHIRRDGQIAMPVTKVFGPASPGENPP